jgi:rubrerythrin
LKTCDEHIRQTLKLVEEMLQLADAGDDFREDVGCGILYGVLRDSAFKIQKLAADERDAHIRKGWWTPSTGEAAAAVLINTTPRKEQTSTVGELKGTKTEKNLLTAFAGESQARNRYTYFSSRARKDGYIQIADIFEETAQQEKEHAKRFFSFLSGGEVEIVAAFPAGIIGETLENLKKAAAGEHYEHTEMYPAFASVAREEGFGAIADVFDYVAVAEKQHEKRYLALAANIETGRVFQRSTPVAWRCRNCGFIIEAKEAPGSCPACAHPQAHFEMLGENW